MYDIEGYGEMIADPIRTGAYARALRSAVKPGSVVVDIGTGTGIFALLACRYGARRVHAIEPAAVIQTAREIAAANGYADRIEFHQAVSTAVVLPERADVIVSDLHGALPIFGAHLPTIIDARKRFLAPGGALIPRSETLWLAAVEAPELHRPVITPWQDNEHGLDMRAASHLVANSWGRGCVTADQLLMQPAHCATFAYASVSEPGFSASIVSPASRAGRAHGFCVWFDSLLADGVEFSNAPGKPETVFGHAFFHWPEAVELLPGDVVNIGVRATLVGEEYVWSWDSTVLGQGDPGREKARFRQSTFLGKPMSPEALRKKAATHVPALNEDGEIDRVILEKMARKTALGDIARDLAARYPARFPRWQDALRRVGDLSSMYSR